MTLTPFHIDPQDLASVVPDCYAAFRPIVADGLTFFLTHLSPARLAEVFRAQADLPVDANLERRLVVFLHACPALHKLGQVVARNRNLDPELRRHLQELESLEPHTPADELREILARELAPAVEPYRVEIAETPLAEGSVAVVVPLTWSDPSEGATAPRRHAVAKVLKPGVAERLAEDLDILGHLADALDERWDSYGLPPLDYRATLNDVADLLLHEVRLGAEQEYLQQAGRQFAGYSDVLVPRLLPFCTETMTVMERVYGLKITDPHAARPWQRPGLFLSAGRALLSRVLFNRDESVLFHGDPHAGNLLATDDGRLAILDWSLAGRLTADDRVQLAQIFMGVLTRDPARIVGAITGLALEGSCESLVQRQVEAALAKRAWYRLPGPDWVMGLLDDLGRAGIRFPSRLLLFRKAFLTAEGVLADLFPCGSLEALLTAEALVQFAWEWPVRWLKPLDGRDYATHISSADLLQLALRPGWQACL
jgi:ubiquinone biosynthesis protein